mmetsp:Transcript_47268/g.106332  ORF Transcript_47268/g.106332 Transcript_47268/m.106332 type:complete len:359 (+) Transcript_47268:490-1566(+)
MPAGLHRSSKLGEVCTAGPRGQFPQARIGLGEVPGAGAPLADLQEGGAGGLEGALGLGAGEDADRRGDPLQLLGAEAGALGPLRRLHLARGLGVLEEGLVRLELLPGVVAEAGALRKLVALRRLVESLLLQRRLKRLELHLLGAHELLMGLLLIGLLGVGLLQFGGKGVVHALKDALDLRGLRGVVTKGIVGDLRSTHGPGAGTDKVLRPVDKMLHEDKVLTGDLVGGSGVLEQTADITHDAQQLRLLCGIQETLLAGARACEHLDGCLKRTDALLRFRLLLRVLRGLLLAHRARLALRLDVVCDVFLQLDDFCTVGRNLALQLLHLCLEACYGILCVADLARLPLQSLLDPARVLVV